MSERYSAYEVAERTGIPLSRLRYLEAEFRDILDIPVGLSSRGQPYNRQRVEVMRALHDLRFEQRLSPPDIRRALRERDIRGRVHVVAVTSGKGGVGKTTVAVNLAVTLAAAQRRTLLVDCDLGLANAHVLTGLQPARTLLDFISGSAKLKDVVMSGPGGISMICGGSGDRRLADLDARWMDHLVSELSGQFASFDEIVLDTGAGVSSQVVRFLGLADDILVTTTPNLSAILDAYGVIKIARQEKLRGTIRLLVNQARDEEQADEVAGRVRACARRFLDFEPDFAGHLFADDAVERSHQERKPLVLSRPRHANTRLFKEIARRLAPGRREADAVDAGLAAAAAG